ncbi:MAG TPA: hypothetical protein VKU01_15270 [Bryobacteraceae bacterium]|nr:hypothetical protein [Bryobacteraceae bacterium]
MQLHKLVLIACLAIEGICIYPLSAQIPGVPKFPGFGRRNKDDSRSRRQQQDGDEGQTTAAGVPVPADSPLFDAFRKLQQQTVFHQRFTVTTNDPQMAEIMTKMGFGPAETITAGDTKQVSMHFKMPVLGQVEDFELRTVSRGNRRAKRWISPASARILKEQDASITKQLIQAEEQAAKSIARNVAAGPLGWVSAGMSAAGAAASAVEAGRIRKQAHDFFEWSCMDAPDQGASQARQEPPPLTDLRVVGDQNVDGVAATSYEFFVRQNGKFHGPVQLWVAKDTGLPLRIGMKDTRSGGAMEMDYFGFNEGADFEIPPCLAEQK